MEKSNNYEIVVQLWAQFDQAMILDSLKLGTYFKSYSEIVHIRGRGWGITTKC